MLALAPFAALAIVLAPPPNDLLGAAELARKEERVAEATLRFRNLLVADPTNVEVHVGWQKLLQALDREDELVEQYRRLLDEGETPWKLRLYGRVLHDPVREEELYRRGLELAPGDFELKLALAYALARQGRFDEALEFVEGALQLQPDSDRALDQLFEIHHRRGTSAECADHFARAAAAHPHDPTADRRRALAALRAGRLAEAEAALDRCLSQGLAKESLSESLAKLRFQQGYLGDAREELDSVLAEDPHDTSALRLSALIAVSQRELDRAIEHAERARWLDPTWPGIYFALAICSQARGELDAAQVSCRRAIQLDPTYAEPHGLLGVLAFEREDVAAAVPHLERAVELDGQNSSTLRFLGHLYAQTGRIEEARRMEERAAQLAEGGPDPRYLSLDPVLGAPSGGEDTPPAFRYSAIVERASSESLESALELLDTFLERDPADRRALDLRARILRRAGRTQEALAVYRRLARAAEPTPTSQAAAVRVADCLYELGEMEAALQQYRAALREHGEKLGHRERLDEIVAAIDRAPPEPERVRIQMAPLELAYAPRTCVPIALHAVLRHHELPSSLEVLVDETMVAGGGDRGRILEYLESRADLEWRSFLAEPESVRRLLRHGLPILLFDDFIEPYTGEWVGHLTVLNGYDELLGVSTAHDPAWITGYGRWTEAQVRGRLALVLAPVGHLPSFADELPGQGAYELMVSVKVGLGSEDPSEVEPRLRQLLSLGADSQELLYFVGFFLLRADQVDRTVEVLQHGAAAEHPTPCLLHLLAQAYERRGDTGLALLTVERVLREEPDYFDALERFVGLGHHSTSERRERCLDATARMVELQPSSASAHFWRGRVLEDAERHDEALPHLRRSLSLGGPEVAKWDLAHALAGTGRVDEAIDSLRAFADSPAGADWRESAEETIAGWQARSDGESAPPAPTDGR